MPPVTSPFRIRFKLQQSPTLGRCLHSSDSKGDAQPVVSAPLQKRTPSGSNTATVLSRLPVSQILRTYFITSISSSPILLKASTALLKQILRSRTPLLSVENNPILRSILWQTFYKQFCAGENTHQISQTCTSLRAQGYSGVILEYALEVLQDAKGNEAVDIAVWRKGMLDSVDGASSGDLVALKWSGMGPAALRRLHMEEAPSKEMLEAMNEVCEHAQRRNISLLPAVEETWTLRGYYEWTLRQQRAYNKDGKCVIYNSYQAYLKQAPGFLSEHLDLAQKEGFTLGVKLVRGAYMATEKRSLIHDTINDTHAAYDGIASALVHRNFNHTVIPSSPQSETWPKIAVVIASHNAASIEKVVALRKNQLARGEQLTPLIFAQLQGMADEVSCSLLAASESASKDGFGAREMVYKYTTWGTITECLNYLIRRADENKDAAGRTAETRRAMRAEIFRRLRAFMRLA